jgi:hypothetical protein
MYVFNFHLEKVANRILVEQETIDEHLATRSKPGHSRDYIDVYLDEMEKNLSTTFSSMIQLIHLFSKFNFMSIAMELHREATCHINRGPFRRGIAHSCKCHWFVEILQIDWLAVLNSKFF